jgi:hypothetical protein
MNEKKTLIYPLRLIKSSLGNEVSPTKSVLNSGQMRSLTLYCLVDMGNDQFLPLNRDYKPLGMNEREFVKYEEFEFLFLPRDLINFSTLWDNGISLGKHAYYTYSDFNSPCNAKSFQRYRSIILSAFFGMNQYNNLEVFKKLWEFKGRNYPNDYGLNIKRFDI